VIATGPYSITDEDVDRVGPRLATLEERPLHVDELPEGHAWGCHDNAGLYEFRALRFDWRCEECIECAKAMVRQEEDPDMEWRRLPDDEVRIVKLSWLVERSLFWLPRMKL
jgi:hypothetical protein